LKKERYPLEQRNNFIFSLVKMSIIFNLVLLRDMKKNIILKREITDFPD
jgi:hypothetical protein